MLPLALPFCLSPGFAKTNLANSEFPFDYFPGGNYIKQF